MVRCNIYKNQNEITKNKRITMKVSRLLIFVVVYSLEYKIKGYSVTNVFEYGKIKSYFRAEICKKSIGIETILN